MLEYIGKWETHLRRFYNCNRRSTYPVCQEETGSSINQSITVVEFIVLKRPAVQLTCPPLIKLVVAAIQNYKKGPKHLEFFPTVLDTAKKSTCALCSSSKRSKCKCYVKKGQDCRFNCRWIVILRQLNGQHTIR